MSRSIKINVSVTLDNVAANVDAERVEAWLRDRFVGDTLYGLNPSDYDAWSSASNATVATLDVLDVEDAGDDDADDNTLDAALADAS